jgi:hypothetical protein
VARNGKYEGLDPMRFFALRRSLNGCPDGRSGPSAEFFICQSFQQRSFLSSFSSLFLFPINSYQIYHNGCSSYGCFRT